MTDKVTACLKAWRTLIEAENASPRTRTPVGMAVPRLLGAVEAALKIHCPAEVYALSMLEYDPREPPRVFCGHTLEETENDRHAEAGTGGLVCLDKHEATVCAECWEENGGEQVEWPCRTYAAIAGELLGEEGA